MKSKLTPTKIVFIIMCALLVTVAVMIGIVAGKFSTILSALNPTNSTEPPSTTAPPVTTVPPETTIPPETTLPEQTTQPTEPEDPSHVHNFVLSEVIPASCENYGYNIYSCSCGRQDIPIDEQVEPTGHSYGAGQVIEATCTQYGCTRYTCVRCGLVDERDVQPSGGHDFQLVEEVAVTCESDGYTLYRCTHCQQEEMSNIIPHSGHDYQFVLEQIGTCESDGYTLYACSICGDQLQENLVTAGGHQYTEWYQLPDGVWQRDCTICGKPQSSYDLKITQEQAGNYAYDTDGTPFKNVRLHVGTDEDPDMYLYTIRDYLDNGSLAYGYAPERGLVVTYTNGLGETVEIVLPMLSDGSAIIPPDDSAG